MEFGDFQTDLILQGYGGAAADLIARYEAISSDELYAPLAGFLPRKPCRAVDLGAGAGRDAAWLAAQGHQVLAVEPVAAFREAGARLHRLANIEWLDDRLPALGAVMRRNRTFDLVNLNGVWQHLGPTQRVEAMRNIAALTAPGGRMIVSVRHGPGAPDRPCFQAPAETTIECAAAHGFALDFEEDRESIQPANRAAGVTWTWLAFSRAI